MARKLLFPLVVAALLLSACTDRQFDRNVDQIVASAENAYNDLAAAVEELGQSLSDDAAAAVEKARSAAEDARAALEAFASDANDKTREALAEAERRVEGARQALEGLADNVPEDVRDAFDRVGDSLRQLAEEIRRALS
jgi:ElaB/YqjD/DUF883 family membrane-anchored ribosome-binding protein